MASLWDDKSPMICSPFTSDILPSIKSFLIYLQYISFPSSKKITIEYDSVFLFFLSKPFHNLISSTIYKGEETVNCGVK